ncbi:MAG: hypothetical protein ACE5KT_10280 [Methanosarcinales archaeon]
MQVTLIKKKTKFKKEALEILKLFEEYGIKNIEIGLFYYLLVNNADFLFRSNNPKQEPILRLRIQNSIKTFRNIISAEQWNSIDLDKTIKVLFQIFNKFIKNNKTAANYFGTTIELYSKNWLDSNKKYNEIISECYFCLKQTAKDTRCLEKSLIKDIVGLHNNGCDIFECKLTASAYVDKLIKQLNDTYKISRSLKELNCRVNSVLITAEFKKTDIIRENIIKKAKENNKLNFKTNFNIVNGFELFGFL